LTTILAPTTGRYIHCRLILGHVPAPGPPAATHKHCCNTACCTFSLRRAATQRLPPAANALTPCAMPTYLATALLCRRTRTAPVPLPRSLRACRASARLRRTTYAHALSSARGTTAPASSCDAATLRIGTYCCGACRHLFLRACLPHACLPSLCASRAPTAFLRLRICDFSATSLFHACVSACIVYATRFHSSATALPFSSSAFFPWDTAHFSPALLGFMLTLLLCRAHGFPRQHHRLLLCYATAFAGYLGLRLCAPALLPAYCLPYVRDCHFLTAAPRSATSSTGLLLFCYTWVVPAAA